MPVLIRTPPPPSARSSPPPHLTCMCSFVPLTCAYLYPPAVPTHTPHACPRSFISPSLYPPCLYSSCPYPSPPPPHGCLSPGLIHTPCWVHLHSPSFAFACTHVCSPSHGLGSRLVALIYVSCFGEVGRCVCSCSLWAGLSLGHTCLCSCVGPIWVRLAQGVWWWWWWWWWWWCVVEGGAKHDCGCVVN